MTEKTLKISEAGHESAGQQDDVEDYPEQSAAQSDYAPGLGLLARILCLGVVPGCIFLGNVAGLDDADDSERKAAEYGHDDGQGEVGRRAWLHRRLLVILRQGSRRCCVWKVGSALRAERRFFRNGCSAFRTIFHNVCCLLLQGLSVPVNIGVAGDHDDVDQDPDAAAAEGQEHDDAGGGVAGVESVDTETAEYYAEDQGDKPSVLLLFGGLRGVEGLPGGVRLGLKRFPATWTKGGIRLDRRSAMRTIVHL